MVDGKWVDWIETCPTKEVRPDFVLPLRVLKGVAKYSPEITFKLTQEPSTNSQSGNRWNLIYYRNGCFRWGSMYTESIHFDGNEEARLCAEMVAERELSAAELFRYGLANEEEGVE